MHEKKSTSVSTPCALWNANIVRGRDTVASVIAWFVTHTHTHSPRVRVHVCVFEGDEVRGVQSLPAAAPLCCQ